MPENLTKDTAKALIQDYVAGQMKEEVKKTFEPIKKSLEDFVDGKLASRPPVGDAGGTNLPETNVSKTKVDIRKSLGDLASDVRNYAAHPVYENLSPRLKGIVEKAPLGASEQVAADGGFLVQQDIASEIYRRINETGKLLKDSGIRRIPITANSNGLDIPAIDEVSRVDGSRWGGVQVFRQPEAGTPSAKKPKYRNIQFRLRKLFALSYATDEVLQDAVALGTILQEAFAEEFGYQLDKEIFKGVGGTEFLGYTNSPALVTVSKEANQVAGTVLAENILNMWMHLWMRSMGKAKWYISQTVLPQLGQMSLKVGTAGVPVFLPMGVGSSPLGGFSSPQYSTLLGMPVEVIEQAPTVGTLNDITLADLSQYVMIEKGGIRGDISMHLKFDTAEMAFRWILRNDGQPLWHKDLILADGSTHVSPFVTLQAR